MGIKNYELQTVLAKVEGVAGTDSNPVPADDAIEVFDFTATPASDTVSRSPNRSFFGNDKQSFVNKRWDLSFTIELAGSGTIDGIPPVDPILLACKHVGVEDTGVDYRYLPDSSSTTTCTIYFFLDGVLHKALGCSGSLNINGAIGDFNKAQVTMIAEYVKPVDQALSGTPDFSAFRNPVQNTEANSICSIHGTLVHGEDFSLDQSNTNQFRESTEIKYIAYTDRKPSGSINCWMQNISEFDPYAIWESEARDVVYWETGTVIGDRFRLSMPAAQIGTPAPRDSSGAAAYTLPIIPHPTASGVDDEYVLIFS